MVMVWLTLCMLGNFVCFFCRQLGFSSSKLSFSKYNQSVKQLVSKSKRQADMGQNCLPRQQKLPIVCKELTMIFLGQSRSKSLNSRNTVRFSLLF